MKITKRIEQKTDLNFKVSATARINIYDTAQNGKANYGKLIYDEKLMNIGLKEGDILNRICYIEGVEDDGTIIKGLLIIN